MSQLTTEQFAELHHLLVTGKKSDAIQLYRLWTGLDQRIATAYIAQIKIETMPDESGTQRSAFGWAVFAMLLVILIGIPSYMLYGVLKPTPGNGLTGMGPPPVAPPKPGTTTPAVTPPVSPRPRMNRRPTTGPISLNLPPLQSAIYGGENERALDLIDGGADVNAPAPGGMELTPLMTAAFRNGDGATDVAEALIEKGADLNARASSGYTALMLAVRHRSPKLVDLLLTKHADVNIANRRGETALDWAKQDNDQAAIAKLTEAGAKTGAELGLKPIPATTRPATRPAMRRPPAAPATLPSVERP